MITGAIKNKVDKIWLDIFSAGLANPLTVIEQLTYLMFIRSLDAKELENESMESLGIPVEKIFPPTPSGQAMRWSRFKSMDSRYIFDIISQRVFPAIKAMKGGRLPDFDDDGKLIPLPDSDDSTVQTAFARFMENAVFLMPTPQVVEKVITGLDELYEHDLTGLDMQGDLYEYMLGKLSTAGRNGQFRTPKHIREMMVALLRPTPDDTICDPACGTAGFLISASEYIRTHHESTMTPEQWEHFAGPAFTGYDTDPTMLRLSAMNLMLHSIDKPDVSYKDSVSKENSVSSRFTMCLANAPLQVADIGMLDELQASQDAAISIEPPVQEPSEPETDIPPDPAISVEARNSYGYTDDAMLPLTKERAMELFERDVPVYLLYGDNTEAMAFEQTEILNHDGIFGIDRADWEAVKEQFPVITENRWQKAFQQNPADSYCIYQLRRDPELAELRFMNSHYLREHGLEPAFDHYEAVYSGALPSDGSTEARLDDLYMKFNTAHPQDYTGHSLSVSDIVVLRQQGAVSSHYVDSVGFVQLPAFLPDNYLKNAEMSMEDDYGMIDGIINNGPKEQPEVKPKAPDLSALFEAARQVVQEDKQVSESGKKPSVLAMLHAPAPSRSEKTAQTKSAERDMI